MCDRTTIVKRAQLVIRSELDRRGYQMKVVAADANIHPNTLGSYFPADRNADPAQIPMGAVYALIGAIPADLLSLLLPDGWHLVEAPADIDHDDLAAGCIDYASAHARARHPDSPGGVDIVDCEDSDLKGRAARLKVAK